MIVDSHAHLDMRQFDPDRETVIQRARDAGVDLILAIGCGTPQGSAIEKTLELTERYDFIWAGIGVSPHDARLADDPYWEQLEKWMAHPRVVLLGEIGLDYHHELSPREVQREALRRQLRMARRHNLPVSIHCRDAWADLLTILEQEYVGATRGAVLHSFTGTRDQALEGAALGFLLSFSGIVTFNNADALREVARALATTQMLVETDCPYLAPVPHRGQRNEPAFVMETVRALARIKGIDVDALARDTSDNALRLLNLPARTSGETVPKMPE